MASRRGYLSQAELEQYANITITDATEADDQISQAEELIDSYVGPQPKFFNRYRPVGNVDPTLSADSALYSKDLIGCAADALSSNTIVLQSSHQGAVDEDFYAGCEIEIIGGPGLGKRYTISASTRDGMVSIVGSFDPAVASGSIYRIYQLGKFPRIKDVYLDNTSSPNRYYKSIPEEIKRAVAAQVQYQIQMGESFFAGDANEKASESFGDYSYTRKQTQGGNALIAPKARLLLRGFVNRKGTMILSS